MKTTIVLTRNFKNKTGAKYCAMPLGGDPAKAVELNNIRLENVESRYTGGDEKLDGLQNFGCGIVLVGQGELPNAGERLEWAGFDFKLKGASFEGCKVLEATAEGMTAFN